MFSLTITLSTPPPQFWVTRKMISGEQSSQGVQGHHGQIRSRSRSGTLGSTETSRSRSGVSTLGSLIGPAIGTGGSVTGPRAGPVVGPVSGPIVGLPVIETISIVGTGSGRMNLSFGLSLSTGVIFSISKGSRAQERSLHHHPGHQPQHQRNFMAK